MFILILILDVRVILHIQLICKLSLNSLTGRINKVLYCIVESHSSLRRLLDSIDVQLKEFQGNLQDPR